MDTRVNTNDEALEGVDPDGAVLLNVSFDHVTSRVVITIGMESPERFWEFEFSSVRDFRWLADRGANARMSLTDTRDSSIPESVLKSAEGGKHLSMTHRFYPPLGTADTYEMRFEGEPRMMQIRTYDGRCQFFYAGPIIRRDYELSEAQRPPQD